MLPFRYIFIALLFSQLTFAQQDTVSYYQHIAPIISDHCQGCHQGNHIGPMPLTNFKEVSAFGQMIKYVTEEKLMPPWRAKENIHGWQYENKLKEAELELIKKWAAGGFTEGEKKPLQPAKEIPVMTHDTAISMAESFEQYGVYYDQYRVFVLPTNYDNDQYISGIQFIPGNGRIVRSCQVSLDLGESSRALDDWDPQYGYFAFGSLGFSASQPNWYSWQAGDGPELLPEGFIKVLPKGAKILLHVHYGPSNQPALDSSSLLLKFTERKPKHKTLRSLPLLSINEITNPPFRIPADSLRRFHAKVTLPKAIKLHSLFPKSHFLGRSWELFAKTPDNKTISLLKIEDWDFKWKRNYKYIQPIYLPKGTILHCLALYDNTLNNLLNPNEPPIEMKTGRRMFEENFWVFMEYSELENSMPDEFLPKINSYCFTSLNKLMQNELFNDIEKTYMRLTSFRSREITQIDIEEFRENNSGKEQTIFPGNYFLELINQDDRIVFSNIIGIWPDEIFE